MIIGGLQKSSLIDFPGMISCVIFTSGCNFDCPYCHNPEIVKGSRQINTKKILDFLKTHKGFLQGVVISGGEPTVQPDLLAFCEQIKNIGYHIKLDTNGSNPKVLLKIINEKLVDYVAMDIKTEPLKYPILIKKSNPEDIQLSISSIMHSDIDYEFRTTCVKPFVDTQIISKISRLIKGAKLYALQQFNNVNILSPDFIKGKSRFWEDKDIGYFKEIADHWVEECIVR